MPKSRDARCVIASESRTLPLRDGCATLRHPTPILQPAGVLPLGLERDLSTPLRDPERVAATRRTADIRRSAGRRSRTGGPAGRQAAPLPGRHRLSADGRPAGLRRPRPAWTRSCRPRTTCRSSRSFYQHAIAGQREPRGGGCPPGRASADQPGGDGDGHRVVGRRSAARPRRPELRHPLRGGHPAPALDRGRAGGPARGCRAGRCGPARPVPEGGRRAAGRRDDRGAAHLRRDPGHDLDRHGRRHMRLRQRALARVHRPQPRRRARTRVGPISSTPRIGRRTSSSFARRWRGGSRCGWSTGSGETTASTAGCSTSPCPTSPRAGTSAA